MRVRLYLYCLWFALVLGASLQAQDLKLWYEQPATQWEEALPLGNSRIGAMVYGIPQREELQLNEETIWSGGPYRNDNPEALRALPKVRELIFEARNQEADQLVNETFFTKTHGMAYQTAGSLILAFETHQQYHDYYRELDIQRAVALTRYTVDGVQYTRESFVSLVHNVVVTHITASRQGALSFDLRYQAPGRYTVQEQGQGLVLDATTTSHEGIEGGLHYQIHTQVQAAGGQVHVGNGSIAVRNATVATVYSTIATNFVDYQTLNEARLAKASQCLEQAMQVEYSAALAQHTAQYSQQFGRFALDLGQVKGSELVPTNQRIMDFARNQDPGLVSLLCQYGRYLLICSSQPGGQPANLQGIWCNSLYPPWDSKYTININTEMNYWPAEPTNLSHTHLPLIEMVKELGVSGQPTARVMYGANGWVAHHNTDLWRVTSPIDFAAAGMWPTGGAWLCQHLWEHYQFGGDKQYLAEVYPTLKGSADYFVSVLVPHPSRGWMVVVPSVSPEQGTLAAGCTMDNQLVFDILTKTARANQILGGDKEYAAQLLDMASRLPPMQIGRYSQLQEWLEDKDDPKNEHRHVSHLYGLYPGSQISAYKTPELFEAARNSLLYRGDMATGWSIGWKVNLWARLLDGNHAYKIVSNMLTLATQDNKDGRTYPNLFTAHPPFQIDGNFGLTAGVAEMLLQSHDGAVHLLPALPNAWPAGRVQGIRARGGFELSMEWESGEVFEVLVHSTQGGNLRIRSHVPLAGSGLRKAEGANPNPLLYSATVLPPLMSKEAAPLQGITLRAVYEYDMPTQAGENYVLNRY